MLIGTEDQICDTLVERRERWDLSYFVFNDDSIDTVAPIVARLRGSLILREAPPVPARRRGRPLPLRLVTATIPTSPRKFLRDEYRNGRTRMAVGRRQGRCRSGAILGMALLAASAGLGALPAHAAAAARPPGRFGTRPRQSYGSLGARRSFARSATPNVLPFLSPSRAAH